MHYFYFHVWIILFSITSFRFMSLQVAALASWWRRNKIDLSFVCGELWNTDSFCSSLKADAQCIVCRPACSSHLLITVAKASQGKISSRNHSLEHSGGSQAHAAKSSPSGPPNLPALSYGHMSEVIFTERFIRNPGPWLLDSMPSA